MHALNTGSNVILVRVVDTDVIFILIGMIHLLIDADIWVWVWVAISAIMI